jgi:type IV secretory pathway VirB2 component (pilin)
MQLVSSSEPESDALLAGVAWLEALVTGPLGTAVAVISVGLVGYAMLRGELPLLRAGQVLLGCAILFAAPVIARELRALVDSPTGPAAGLPQPVSPGPMAAPPPFDPYAGAAVPEAEATFRAGPEQ